VLEAWRKELEGLILALTLAGYECPELILARRDQPTGWLRMLCWEGLVDDWDPEEPLVMVGDGDWTAVTGVSAGDIPPTATSATLLRVEVRRTIDSPVRTAEELPPRFPPIPLAGLVSDYHAGPPDTTDPFADPMDGWIAFGHLSALPGDSGSLKTAKEMGALADEARDDRASPPQDRFASDGAESPSSVIAATATISGVTSMGSRAAPTAVRSANAAPCSRRPASTAARSRSSSRS
jgi:hypothetical protein